jgi:O-antigen/teichoic acid export membrane protein
VYGSGRLALQLVSFITLPILTRVFTPAEYGIVETITTFVSIVGVFAALALNSAAQRSYYDHADDSVRERRLVVSTGLWTTLAWSTALSLALLLASGPLSELFFGTRDHADLIALALLIVPLTIATTYLQDVLRLFQQPGRYVLVSVLLSGLTIAFVLWFVVVEDRGLLGIYLGGLLAAPVPLVVAWLLVRRMVALEFSRSDARVMLAYALPLLPVAAATWITQLADRFFLLHFTSTAEVGLFGVGNRLANVLMLAVIAFGVAWSPFALDLYSRDRDRERGVRARAFAAVGITLGFGAVVLGVWAREFFRIVTDPAFEDAYKVVGLLLGSVVAFGLCGVTMTAITITRQTKYFAYYAAYTTALSLALNFILIPPFGMVGAAVASFATFSALAVLYFVRAQRLDPAPFPLRPVLVALAVAAALIAIGSAVRLESVALSVLAKLPLVLVYPLVVWRLGWLRHTRTEPPAAVAK